MPPKHKKVLIIDEYGFSRICSAILTNGGYETDVADHCGDLRAKLSTDSIGLVVTSYPFGSPLFDELRDKDIPIIVLTDGIDERLMKILGDFRNSCCMIKPVDYDKFKSIVRQAFDGAFPAKGGYRIV